MNLATSSFYELNYQPVVASYFRMELFGVIQLNTVASQAI